MIMASAFRTGVTIEVDNNIWQVVEFQHVKPARGGAFVRTKLRNLRNRSMQEKTFRAGEKMPRAHIDRKNMQYLYASGSIHAFMDTETYEQIEVQGSQIESELKFLKENMEVAIISYKGEIIGIELPNNVELIVTETEPGIKGDTVSGGTKSATLETGHTLQVPLFVNQDDVIVISTDDGKYMSRAQ